jgi:hypothetical protein
MNSNVMSNDVYFFLIYGVYFVLCILEFLYSKYLIKRDNKALYDETFGSTSFQDTLKMLKFYFCFERKKFEHILKKDTLFFIILYRYLFSTLVLMIFAAHIYYIGFAVSS